METLLDILNKQQVQQQDDPYEIDTSIDALRIHHEVNAFEFLTSSEYLNVDPFPFQSLVFKTLFGLWDIYPPDKGEEQLIMVLKNNWNIKVNMDPNVVIDTLVAPLGRRSGKSTLFSFLATYGMYTLICKGNPQEYYGLISFNPIHIVHVAAKGEQAADVFTLTSNNIRRIKFFHPYIDFDKNSSTHLRIFSPYDKALNDRATKMNRARNRDDVKEPMYRGSLNIESITTSGATNRGKSIYYLMLSEFAHVERTKFGMNDNEMEILSENPRTDYALFKAMSPSVDDYGTDRKILLESSPREKGGQFYHQYCIGGGMEQEDAETVVPEKGYQVIQLATWEANPNRQKEDYDRKFKSDPVGASMEYGGHFGNPSGQFITEELINSIIVPQRGLIDYNPGTWEFIITVDPGGKAKKKKADSYVVAWGHEDEHDKCFWVDGMKSFDATIRPLGDGRFEQMTVDPNMVTAFIVSLVEKLGGRKYIKEIAYDQWESAAAVHALQSVGLPAIETTFTNAYKSEMYGNFLEKAGLGLVRMYGADLDGCVRKWRTEMKFLQRVISGNTVYFRHPESGPIQNDDMADACFLGDTKVLTVGGYKPISEILVGDYVLTHTGNFKRVIATMRREYSGDIVNVRCHGSGKYIGVTPNHPFYVQHYQECGFKIKENGICTPHCDRKDEVGCTSNWKDDLYWSPASDLKKNMQIYHPVYNGEVFKSGVVDLCVVLPNYIAEKVFVDESFIYYGACRHVTKSSRRSYIPKPLRRNAKSVGVSRFVEFDEDLFRLFGYYIAEGSCTHRGIQFTFHEDEIEFVEDVAEILHEKFGLTPKFVHNPESRSKCVYVYSKFLGELFEYWFGRGAKNKQIPFFILTSECKLLSQFICGYWRGDGCRTAINNFSAGTVSEQLCYQLRFALLRLGVDSTISTFLKTGSSIRGMILRGGSIYYVIGVRGNNAIRFGDCIGNPITEERELHIKTWIDEAGSRKRITNIRSEYYEGLVYNLEVEDDHSYVTEIGSAHNCANLVHRLILRSTPTKESIDAARKHGMGPIMRKTGVMPKRGPVMWGGTSNLRGKVLR